MDEETWRLLRTAGLIACLMLGVTLAVPLVQEDRFAPIPVIAPPASPVRVRPDRPGGMEVAGLDSHTLDESFDNTDKPAVLGPAPEEPAPAALRAQIQGAQAGIQDHELDGSISSAVAALSADDTGKAQDVRTTATPAKVSHPAPSGLTAPGGVFEIQLAVLGNEPAAFAEWARLQERMPQVLGSSVPLVQPAQRNGAATWRLRVAGFYSRQQAQQFCERVQAAGTGCVVAGS